MTALSRRRGRGSRALTSWSLPLIYPAVFLSMLVLQSPGEPSQSEGQPFTLHPRISYLSFLQCMWVWVCFFFFISWTLPSMTS